MQRYTFLCKHCLKSVTKFIVDVTKEGNILNNHFVDKKDHFVDAGYNFMEKRILPGIFLFIFCIFVYLIDKL